MDLLGRDRPSRGASRNGGDGRHPHCRGRAARAGAPIPRVADRGPRLDIRSAGGDHGRVSSAAASRGPSRRAGAPAVRRAAPACASSTPNRTACPGSSSTATAAFSSRSFSRRAPSTGRTHRRSVWPAAPCAGIYERSDVDVREKEGLPKLAGLLAGGSRPISSRSGRARAATSSTSSGGTRPASTSTSARTAR